MVEYSPFNTQVPSGVLPPQDAFQPGDKPVLMVFPKRVILTMANWDVTNPDQVDRVNPTRRIHYPAGIHEVPERLANHWYLGANGVVRHESALAVPTAASVDPSPVDAEALAQPAKTPKKKG